MVGRPLLPTEDSPAEKAPRRSPRAAIGAIRELADISGRYHRVKPIDVLIAATAQEHSIGVLHCDHHFDRLSEVLHFQSFWVTDADAPELEATVADIP
jgi:hypothetical protein